MCTSKFSFTGTNVRLNEKLKYIFEILVKHQPVPPPPQKKKKKQKQNKTKQKTLC